MLLGQSTTNFSDYPKSLAMPFDLIEYPKAIAGVSVIYSGLISY